VNTVGKSEEHEDRKYLSDEYEAAPHIERDKTIISTFLEPGEREELEKRKGEEPKRFNQYKKPKTWMDYWEQREEIYRKKKKMKVEIYEPTASEKLVALIGYLAFFVPICYNNRMDQGQASEGPRKRGVIMLKKRALAALMVLMILAGAGFAYSVSAEPTDAQALPVVGTTDPDATTDETETTTSTTATAPETSDWALISPWGTKNSSSKPRSNSCTGMRTLCL
jgi:hypothetical protein